MRVGVPLDAIRVPVRVLLISLKSPDTIISIYIVPMWNYVPWGSAMENSGKFGLLLLFITVSISVADDFTDCDILIARLSGDLPDSLSNP
jgi:hypothetical protein